MAKGDLYPSLLSPNLSLHYIGYTKDKPLGVTSLFLSHPSPVFKKPECLISYLPGSGRARKGEKSSFSRHLSLNATSSLFLQWRAMKGASSLASCKARRVLA